MFGIRSPLEESRYAVEARLDRGVEIRIYAPRRAAETGIVEREDGAFRRLFGYIAGANVRDARIAMTTPVAEGTRIAMTVPVQQGGAGEGDAGARVMRFFLPEALADDPPAPKDPRLRLVSVPEARMAVLRFSGRPSPRRRAAREAELADVLAAAGLPVRGRPFFMGYDPPFTIPALRRNEVAVALGPA